MFAKYIGKSSIISIENGVTLAKIGKVMDKSTDYMLEVSAKINKQTCFSKQVIY